MTVKKIGEIQTNRISQNLCVKKYFLFAIGIILFLGGIGIAMGGGGWAFAIGTIGHAGPLTLISAGLSFSCLTFIVTSAAFFIRKMGCRRVHADSAERLHADSAERLHADSVEGKVVKKVTYDFMANAKIVESQLAKSPVPIKIEFTEGLEGLELEELIAIWESVSEKNNEYGENIYQLREWLQNSVPDPEEYDNIPKNLRREAANLLKGLLREIIFAFKIRDDLTDDKKQRIILSLIEASKMCSPTWVEVAKKECFSLKNSYDLDNGEQILLEYVQSLKEQLILDKIKRHNLGSERYVDNQDHWNMLNYFRWMIGNEVGLDLSSSQFDSARLKKPSEKYPKEYCMRFFLDEYTPQVLVDGITQKIILENSHGKENGFDQRLTTLLAACAKKHATNAGIDIAGDEFYEGIYVLENFYEKVEEDRKYRIKEEAVYLMLKEIELLT